jgi:hypothetical protein
MARFIASIPRRDPRLAKIPSSDRIPAIVLNPYPALGDSEPFLRYPNRFPPDTPWAAALFPSHSSDLPLPPIPGDSPKEPQVALPRTGY